MIKSGIILATAASGLLIGSPVAWAACHKDSDHHHTKSSHHGDRDHGDRDHGDRDHGDSGRNDKSAKHNGKDCNTTVNNSNRGRNSGGLVNISDNNVSVPVNACHNDILSGTAGILANNLRNNSH